MKLKDLLSGISVIDKNVDLDADVDGVFTNSAEAKSGGIFIALKGGNFDGHDFIDSLPDGCIAVCERQVSIGSYVLVENTRKAYAKIAANFFGNPADNLKLIFVTGTNGKTSTAHYIASMLNFVGIKCGVIGTEGHFVCGEKIGQSLTTPDPMEFNELLKKMSERGCECVVSEASAHAIHLNKLYGLQADIGVFTNASQDHLDFFKDYETYINTKINYFTKENMKRAVVNVDDEAGRKILQNCEAGGLDVITYGLTNPADCFAVNVREDELGIRFVANLNDDIIECKSPLFGDFNVYNLLCALTVVSALGLHGKTLGYAASKIRTVKGRFSVMHNEKGTVIIDFAHTPEGLKQVLAAARIMTKSRLICVFGCGGERDKTKRKLMGKVASKYADELVLTADNSRTEKTEDIIEDIMQGVSVKDVKKIPDRFEAVRYALFDMDEGDTLVIAGKGNENYIELNGKKQPYSDFDVVERYGQLK